MKVYIKPLIHSPALPFQSPTLPASPGTPVAEKDAFGPRLQPSQQSFEPLARHPQARAADAMQRLRYWNEMALKANALDHTPVAPGEIRTFGEQLGPGRTSRALAIVHIAMFDALNAIARRYPGYAELAAAASGTSPDAAIANAAHDTLVALFPSQAALMHARLAADLAQIPDGPAKTNGTSLGRHAAAAILALRANDGSGHHEARIGIDFFPSDGPGKWRQDPVSLIPLALGAHWGNVKPFALRSAERFLPEPPPALGSAAYAAAFNEAKQVGGDGVTTPTQRTPEQTRVGVYWSYDGAPQIGTPPRLFNQITVEIASRREGDVLELARMLALANVAMADTAIVLWKTKYYHQFWRPVTGIREADEGTGPSGLGDGNPATRGDPSFTPLGAQASNLSGPNFTPPFPASPSGHAGFGSAVFQMLRNFYRTDRIAFSFVSDEYNGVTRDNHGNVRPHMARRFASLSQAEEESAQSRIYLGIHWSFDKAQGLYVGRRVANYVFRHGLVQAPH